MKITKFCDNCGETTHNKKEIIGFSKNKVSYEVKHYCDTCYKMWENDDFNGLYQRRENLYSEVKFEKGGIMKNNAPRINEVLGNDYRIREAEKEYEKKHGNDHEEYCDLFVDAVPDVPICKITNEEVDCNGNENRCERTREEFANYRKNK